MSMRTLETAILNELRVVAKKKAIRLKDIMQWQTGGKEKSPFDAHTGEELVFLPDLSIWCAYKKNK